MRDNEIVNVDSVAVTGELTVVLLHILPKDVEEVLAKLTVTPEQGNKSYVLSGKFTIDRDDVRTRREAIEALANACVLSMPKDPALTDRFAYQLEALVADGDAYIDYGCGVKGVLSRNSKLS